MKPSGIRDYQIIKITCELYTHKTKHKFPVERDFVATQLFLAD
jgi:hypothetical protein